jgi:serine/threonine protein kinase
MTNFYSKYKVIPKGHLGKGNYGSVMKATELSTGKIVAIKTQKAANQLDAISLRREMDICCEVKHENILDSESWYEGEPGDSEVLGGGDIKFYLVMELCEGGNLESKLSGSYDDADVLNWSIQFCRGLAYLHHEKKIAHRDIKPCNIVFSNGVLKICDFGFGKRVDQMFAGSYLGTRSYMAPELYQKERHYDESVDLWAYGICLYRMLKHIPENDCTFMHNRIENDATVLDFSKDVDEKLAAACRWCLEFDPLKRPTAKQLLSFLESNNKIVVEKGRFTVIDDGPNLLEMKISPLKHIVGKIPQQFWKESKWEDKVEIPWEDFHKKYFTFLKWGRHEKEEEVAIRTLMSYPDKNGVSLTNVFKFVEMIAKCGFPFDRSILSTMARYHPNNSSGNPEEEYLALMSKLAENFIDPISQQSIKLDQIAFNLWLNLHCNRN